MLRVGSRLINADISYEQKYPLILPPKDTVVRSMIRSTHLRLVHAGPKATLTVIRRKFWVNRGLQATKSVINACVNCQKRHKKPMDQKMAALPDYRVKMMMNLELFLETIKLTTPWIPFTRLSLQLSASRSIRYTLPYSSVYAFS